jgi:hypothetical protein
MRLREPLRGAQRSGWKQYAHEVGEWAGQPLLARLPAHSAVAGATAAFRHSAVAGATAAFRHSAVAEATAAFRHPAAADAIAALRLR